VSTRSHETDVAAQRIRAEIEHPTGVLHLSNLNLRELPEEFSAVKGLRHLYLSGNQLTECPASVWQHQSLLDLDLSDNRLTRIPPDATELRALFGLRLDNNQISEFPDVHDSWPRLQSLTLRNNALIRLPSLRGCVSLRVLDLRWNRIRDLPEGFEELRNLQDLRLDGNKISELSPEVLMLPALQCLHLRGNRLVTLPPVTRDMNIPDLELWDNPLAPELNAAISGGQQRLWRFLQAVDQNKERICEAKLLFVGEGAVGKSTLLAALRGDEWQDDRDPTHGLEVLPLIVQSGDRDITLHAWDFGGQPIYRSTHQFFFSAPAMYLVVWKPREGPEQGFVDYWIRLIRHRVGDSARVLVVATHGGPQQLPARLDEADLRRRHGDMIVDFFSVDSRTGFGLSQLQQAIASTASALPHVERWFPARWREYQDATFRTRKSYLPWNDYLTGAHAAGLTSEEAEALAEISHQTGRWIHYADDPDLRDVLVLQGHWLSKAISFVLEDQQTSDANGLLPHDRLPLIWSNPSRPIEEQYPLPLQRVFLRIMERFDISYRIADSTAPEWPMSLVGQLVQGDRPALDEWKTYGPGMRHITRVCTIHDSHGVPTFPEGLTSQLLVRFHRFSLGRIDHRDSVHWANGFLLDDGHNGRALVFKDSQGIVVSVKGAYPEFFVDRLTTDIVRHVSNFWPGLSTAIMLTCHDACLKGQSGNGLFEVTKLKISRANGHVEYPCPACPAWVNIDTLLRGSDAAPSLASARSLEQIVQLQLAQLLGAVEQQQQTIESGLQDLGTLVVGELSRSESRLEMLLRGLDDETRNGPRLFGIAPLERNWRHPEVTHHRIQVELWCEHSRLPLKLINGPDGEQGIYSLQVPMDWFIAAAPWLQAAMIALRSLLPIGIALAKLDVSEPTWRRVGFNLQQAEKSLDELVDEAKAEVQITRSFKDPSFYSQRNSSAPVTGGLLRRLHVWLLDQDPGLAGLVRVRNRDHYLWVHPRFVSIYEPPPPVIPI
jgi:hypothetical protein